MLNARIALIGLFIFALAACGDDDDESSGPSGDTAISDLSPSEAQQICDAGFAQLSSTFSTQVQCEFVGIFTAALTGGLPAACTAARDACVQTPPATLQTFSCDPIAAPDLVGCNATVNQFNGCISEAITQLQTLLSAFTCANIDNLDQAQLVELEALSDLSLEDYTSCAALQTACPGIID